MSEVSASLNKKTLCTKKKKMHNNAPCQKFLPPSTKKALYKEKKKCVIMHHVRSFFSLKTKRLFQEEKFFPYSWHVYSFFKRLQRWKNFFFTKRTKEKKELNSFATFAISTSLFQKTFCLGDCFSNKLEGKATKCYKLFNATGHVQT